MNLPNYCAESSRFVVECRLLDTQGRSDDQSSKRYAELSLDARL